MDSVTLVLRGSSARAASAGESPVLPAIPVLSVAATAVLTLVAAVVPTRRATGTTPLAALAE